MLFRSRSIRELRDFESTYKASDDVPTINAKDWPKTMESILEYLHHKVRFGDANIFVYSYKKSMERTVSVNLFD